jgi:hypothetical protein
VTYGASLFRECMTALERLAGGVRAEIPPG